MHAENWAKKNKLGYKSLNTTNLHKHIKERKILKQKQKTVTCIESHGIRLFLPQERRSSVWRTSTRIPTPTSWITTASSWVPSRWTGCTRSKWGSRCPIRAWGLQNPTTNSLSTRTTSGYRSCCLRRWFPLFGLCFFSFFLSLVSSRRHNAF